MESVNGWRLVGSADSQEDRGKRSELHVENKENQSLLENFDVFPLGLKLYNPCGSVANKTTFCSSRCLALLFALPSISFALSNSY